MIFKSYLVEQDFEILNQEPLLIYGENIGLKNEFKKQIKKNNQNSEILNLTQEEILQKKEIFFADIYNVSLFEKSKIYLINNSNDKFLDTIKEIEKNNIKDCKIYLFSDVLEKKSKLRNFFEKLKIGGSIACYGDNEITIRKIITNNLRGFKGLTPQNINMIISSCNLDRDKLSNELNKIITFFSDKTIEDAKLEQLLNIKVNENFNILKDEALNGNKNQTNKLLSNTQIDTEKNILYLNIINQRLNKLSEINELVRTSSLENVLNTIRPPIFWKDKPFLLMQARKWSNKKIRNILNQTYSLEIQIKSNSVVNKNILIKKLLIDICELANS